MVEAYTITVTKVVEETTTMEVLIVPSVVAPPDEYDDRSTFTCHCGEEMAAADRDEHNCRAPAPGA